MNTNPRITQGAWELCTPEGSTVAMKGQAVITAPAPDGATYEEEKANARAIAAIPRLLKFAERVAALDPADGLGASMLAVLAQDAKEILEKARVRS